MIVVTDAGPLIYLAGGGQLGLLRLLYADVVVPRLVYEEVTVAGAGLVGAAEVAAAGWLRVVERGPDAGLLDQLDAGGAAYFAAITNSNCPMFRTSGSTQKVR